MATRKFQTPGLMQQAVDHYFDQRREDGVPPTLSGLALALGFTSLGALSKYRNYDDGDFRDIIDAARLRIMDANEVALAQGKSSNSFLLKNLDKEFWKDRTEQAVDLNDVREGMSAEERLNRLQALVQRAKGRIIEGEAERVEDDSWMQ